MWDWQKRETRLGAVAPVAGIDEAGPWLFVPLSVKACVGDDDPIKNFQEKLSTPVTGRIRCCLDVRMKEHAV